jgi:SAM-dependent methyltransferase
VSAGERTPPQAADYDLFVDWEKRLAREGPFFRDVFERHSAHSVIDVGCGTGRHAILFASWGLRTLGVDPSGEMLAQARANADGAGSDATFLTGGFGDLEGLGLGPVDAVTCTGNALPHVDGPAGLRAALADMAAVLRPGGVLVLSSPNVESLSSRLLFLWNGRLRFFTAEERHHISPVFGWLLDRFLREAGLQPIETSYNRDAMDCGRSAKARLGALLGRALQPWLRGDLRGEIRLVAARAI